MFKEIFIAFPMQSYYFSAKKFGFATKSHFPTFQRKKSLILRFPEKYEKRKLPFTAWQAGIWGQAA
jgi:hypothetical protein